MLFNKKSTFDDKVILNYFDRIVVPYVQPYSYERILLWFDKANCHTPASFEGYCDEHNIDTLFIPGCMTNLLQPADFC